MKLRIRGDSLRLRLTQGEVRSLRETGSVVQTTRFGPGNTLTYALVTEPRGEIVARFDAGRIEVALPLTAATAWADGDEVGLRMDQTFENGELSILVEKDFQCLAPRSGEDDDDAFPHPGSATGPSC